jgi:hypothetical protein
MNRNSSQKTKQTVRKGLKVDRITRIINEQWPEIWDAATDRQNRQLENRRVLILAARDQLRKKLVKILAVF